MVNHVRLVVSAFVWYRDMVKRLINKMDFEALEVKMKKCKVNNYYSTIHINHTWLPSTNVYQ